MGNYTGGPVKGDACQALDALSGNRAGLLALSSAIAGLAGANFANLEAVFARHLLPVKFAPARVAETTEYLRTRWFDPASPKSYFPGKKVAEIYAIGFIKTIELATANNMTLPIDSWWVPDQSEFSMLNLKSPLQVTLAIITPSPARRQNEMMAAAAAAVPATVGFSTRLIDGTVQTRKLETP